jgi:hypothetical protein
MVTVEIHGVPKVDGVLSFALSFVVRISKILIPLQDCRGFRRLFGVDKKGHW